MRKTFLYRIWLFVALLCTAACNEEEIVTESPIPPYIAPASAQVSAAAGSYLFEVSEKLTDLAVVSDQQWCTATVEGGGIRATYTQNDRNATRTAILSVSRTGDAATIASIALTQSRATIDLAEQAEVIALNAAAEAVEVPVTCDVEWTATTKADWLTLEPKPGKLVITPTQNPSSEIRKERITLSVGEITRSFTVEQTGAVLTIDTPNVNLLATAGSSTVAVVSNVAWTATCNADWLSVSNAEGKLTLTRQTNAAETRSAQVTVTAGKIVRKLSISQTSVYESMLGTWTLAGQAYDTKTSAFINRSFIVTVTVDKPNASYKVDGFGTGFLASTTEAPFTLAIDPEKRTVSIAIGEMIGTYNFMGFSQDPDQNADVRTIYITKSGQGVATDYSGGQTLSGTVAADLNTIVFQENVGMAFGMWAHTSQAWSGTCCSYRMIDISLTREIARNSSAPAAANRFF